MQEITNKLANLSVKNGSRMPLVRCKQYDFNPTPNISIPLLSYNVQDYAYKQEGVLPIHARGLFVEKNTHRIAIRGYDKFFNIGEVATTTWNWLCENTQGPYEMTLKENGCIIYMTGLEGHVLVTSKHAFGSRDDGEPTHSDKGYEWLHKHLASVGKSTGELAAFLESNNLTAVFELADDEFEEHV
ncbi:hypothetical protein HDU91_006112, partial [Kappamyces sp. JEL0680]